MPLMATMQMAIGAQVKLIRIITTATHATRRHNLD
jgi:hypothetical protein